MTATESWCQKLKPTKVSPPAKLVNMKAAEQHLSEDERELLLYIRSLERALNLVSKRLWKNGCLTELADKALSGAEITIDDTDIHGEKRQDRWDVVMKGI